jgi:DNA-binding response OmpR family regulator
MAGTTTDKQTKILVAEDNPALALVVRFHLEQAGFQVTVARDGAEAWHLLERESFDVLITDQQMPELSGSEVCKRMRQEVRLAKVPIVMLTAKGFEMELSRLRHELGVWEVLPKPFSVQQLVETVESCCASLAAER